MRLNYISNIDLQDISGGFSAMNAVAYEALSEIADVNYVGPISPQLDLLPKAISKLERYLGKAGDFSFFSEARLRRISEEVNRRRHANVDFDFYHGFTPWIRCRYAPYFAWSDCCFQDYIDIYHPPGSFKGSDVARISCSESSWISIAKGIFLSSDWARVRTEAHYGLRKGFCRNVSIFGAMQIPLRDEYAMGHEFLFVSTDYVRKNGSMCRQAMNRVWQRFPNARLKIIGAAPRPQDLDDRRVSYEGYFDKSKPDHLAAFTSHLSRAFALVHPTAADTTAMIVIEAAFHGCPSITVEAFALPEVTGNGTYALLQKSPPTVHSLATAMVALLEDPERYRLLRVRAREFAIARFSRTAFKKRMQDALLLSVARSNNNEG
jgi:glycosyltransferase involved in cell wall biosynthesis